MTQLTEAIVPAKFMSLAGELILVLVITYTLEENVYASISNTLSTSSSDYLQGERSVLTCVALSVLLLLFQILSLFAGVSLFYDKVNATRKSYVEFFLNCLGIFWFSWFIYGDVEYSFIWGIWAFTILIPALLELAMVVRVGSIYKAKV
jgi:hypothetical protein